MQFVLRLERLGLFERVDLARARRQSIGTTDANVFRIDCLLQRRQIARATEGRKK